MTWIPVSARNAAEDNHYLLDLFDCEVLFFQSSFADAIAALRPRLPKVKHWICIDGDLRRCRARRLADWVKDQPATKPHVHVDLDDVIGSAPPAAPPACPRA